jgi:nicotinamide-nucleotide amidase
MELVMFKITLLTIGDEICIGQIANTNSAWISEKCTKLGAKVICHSVIRDNKEDMISEINRLIKISDLLIITGGLGPTHDDITKPVLTEYFDDKLEIDKDTLAHLEEMFRERGYKLTERNKGQALIPSKAKVLINNVGTAPGLLFENDNKFVIALPGVPTEMMSIMSEFVLPLIKKKISERKDNAILYKTYYTTGITESNLADIIGETSEFLQGGSLAFLPSYMGVRLRIGIEEKNIKSAVKKLNTIEKQLYEKAERFIIGDDEDSLISKVAEILKSKRKTVSVAESCTGGLLGAELTSVSGSSAYFNGGAIVYSNDIKEKILDVDRQILIKFGAVSKEVAMQLAKNVRLKFNTDFGIGITGIAGPTGGTAEKPVGMVWISIADSKQIHAKKYLFGKDRYMNRQRAVGTALALLLKELKAKE